MKKPPLHVAITANSAWNVLNFRRPLILSLLQNGYAVTVIAPDDPALGELQALGCEVAQIRIVSKSLNPFAAITTVLRFRSIFASVKPDIVFGFTIKNNLFGGLAARLCNITFIPNVTGLGTAFLSGKTIETVAKVLYRKAFEKMPTVFFQNEDDRALFIEGGLVTTEQAALLPGSGVDLDEFAPARYPDTKGPIVFLLIARLLRDKGIYEFVTAARLIKERHSNVSFRLLGEVGSDNRTAIHKNELREWIQEGTIEYLGVSDDVRCEIRDAHCVVLPSYREGAPRTLIEASAMARPIIATDVPGCRSILDKDSNGFFCKLKDAASLAETFQRFLDLSEEQRKQMGDAGRQKMVDEFDQKFVIAAYEEAIERAIR